MKFELAWSAVAWVALASCGGAFESSGGGGNAGNGGAGPTGDASAGGSDHGGAGGAGAGGAGAGGGASSGGAAGAAGGADSGSRECPPMPGCNSRTSCPDADGCNTCGCSNGQWACTLRACQVDAGPPKSCDDPSRTYVAKSATKCATVRFACDAGVPFNDTCGCGCASGGPADCGNIQCLRANQCVVHCGATPVSSGCCPCPAGTIDSISCPKDGGGT